MLTVQVSAYPVCLCKDLTFVKEHGFLTWLFVPGGPGKNSGESCIYILKGQNYLADIDMLGIYGRSINVSPRGEEIQFITQ